VAEAWPGDRVHREVLRADGNQRHPRKSEGCGGAGVGICCWRDGAVDGQCHASRSQGSAAGAGAGRLLGHRQEQRPTSSSCTEIHRFFSDPGEWAAEKMDWFPGVASEEEKAQKRQQDAAEQARQAMRVYQDSSNPNIDAAPAFTAPQALDGSVGSLPLTSTSTSTSTGIGAPSTAPAMAGAGGPAHVMAAHQPATHQAAALPAAYQQGGTPPTATVSQLTPAGPARPAGDMALPGRWASNTTPNDGLAPGALISSAGVGGSNTARPTGARGGLGGTRLTGAGRTSGANHAGFGPRPSAEFGTRTTAGSSLPVNEMSEARGGASSTRGAGGAGYGQPFVGGGSQRSEQDREHRSKYLLHDDSNAIVGDLPPTAPPVIGADY
jgi:hypothetical protein